MFHSPSYHHISPLSRSRSDTRSNNSYGLHRSSSIGGGGGSSYTMPSYGYGGGYMARSLSRSNSSTLFGRSLLHSALSQTPPLHSVAVQRSTPHYSDKYPYVRYSYGNTDTGMAILAQTETNPRIGTNRYTLRDSQSRPYLESKYNSAYGSYGSASSIRNNRVERPVTPARDYVRYMPVDTAMDMYKKRCMTVGTLSKYWLSPATWTSRREKESNMSYSMSQGNYSYASRYNRPHYSSVTGRFS